MKHPIPLSPLAIILLVIANSLSSCVTIFCTKNTRINIKSDRGTKLVYDPVHYVGIRSSYDDIRSTDGSYTIPSRGLTIIVPRSRSVQLPVTIQKDSVQRTFYLLPKHDARYYWNVMSYGLGFLIDHKNPNRFNYDSHVYLTIDDQKNIYRQKFAPYRKNDLTFNLSVPYVNNFYFNEGTTTNAAGGFWGITGGADYHYADDKFVSFQVGVAVNLPLPFPAAIDYFGDTITRSAISSIFLNVKNNHTFGRFDVGYGLSASRNSWVETRSIRDSGTYTASTLHDYNNISVGGAFSAYYRLGKNIHMGMLYQPYLFSLYHAPLTKYEHTITFDVMWRFRL